MSIDRIGKGSGVAGTQAPSVPTPASEKRSFEVERAAPAGASAAISPADRVRSGELDMKAYVDSRVEEATRHLEGKLAPPDLDRVRSMLRDQVAHDPAVRDMVRAATGVSPPETGGEEG